MIESEGGVLNEIEADIVGKVTDFYAQNGKPVQAGESLMRIASLNA